jgi:hypothetical protein
MDYVFEAYISDIAGGDVDFDIGEALAHVVYL